MSNMHNHHNDELSTLRIQTTKRRRYAVLTACSLSTLFIVAGCGGSGAGKSDNSLSGAISSTRAHYQIMDLATGQVSATGDVADIATNPIYRTSKLVFRLVDVESGTVGTSASGLGAALDPVEAAVGSTPFYLAVFETTQAQWQTIAGNTPWTLLTSLDGTDDVRIGSDYPAIGISHDLATAAIASYRSAHSVTLALPNDTQWEIACRAGGSSTYAWGNNDDAVTVTASAVVWETANNTRGARPVGQRSASSLGIFDIHGNVAELTSDIHLRGGSWNDPLSAARAAHRANIDPSTRHLLAGVRLMYVP